MVGRFPRRAQRQVIRSIGVAWPPGGWVAIGVCVLAAQMPVCAEVLLQVAAPVVDLRSEPGYPAADTRAHDPNQEFQLVFGERVIERERRGEWVRVESLDQWEYTHHKKWEGYPGWVRSDALRPIVGESPAFGIVRSVWAPVYSLSDPAPTLLRARPPLIRLPLGSVVTLQRRSGGAYETSGSDGRPARIDQKHIEPISGSLTASIVRLKVWRTARRLIGVPYYWGGLSPESAAGVGVVTGVDCSGMTHLAYRSAGIQIPRDSHEQWMMSDPLIRADLERGDLVFLANADRPEKVVHVMMYAGGEFLIEGPGTGLTVRRVTFKQKLGRRLASIDSGDRVGEKVVYFGRARLNSFRQSKLPIP